VVIYLRKAQDLAREKSDIVVLNFGRKTISDLKVPVSTVDVKSLGPGQALWGQASLNIFDNSNQRTVEIKNILPMNSSIFRIP
jgi:hypothetical protein